ncbi:hypothetical protein BDZ89DRAFT_1127982 [Hymenopellis radicata]|nr:hypothetical protein BDZ89DRAFT_1127982 [Hymenopellis radicata]
MPPSSSRPSSSLKATRPRKSKVQACSTCRKQKARCEVLETNSAGVRKCHRCTVLKAPCSFESDTPSTLPPPTPPSAESPPADTLSALVILPGVSAMHRIQSHALDANPTPKVPFCFTAPPTRVALANYIPPLKPYVWTFVGPCVDWSAPMVAMQELAKVPDVGSSSFVVHDECLEHILPPNEIDNLLSTFTAHYTPWLNFNLVRNAPHHAFLDLVCCTIASRYLDSSTRFIIAPRLQNLTRDKIAEMAFNPAGSQSLDTVQALIILALWAPICGFGAQGDGKMLIGMGVTMAMNMRLNEASSRAIKMRTGTSPLNPMDIAEYEDTMNRARIWIVLSNTETMLCIGSGRPAVSKRSKSDMDLFPILSPDTLEEGRDLRIRLFSELFNATEQGLQVELPRREDIDAWYDGVSASLHAMDRLVELITPLPIARAEEKFFYHILHCVVLCCRQCVLYNALFICRTLVEDQYPLEPAPQWTWFHDIQPHGLNIVPLWGMESIRNAESVLLFTLQCDPASLATSPDIVFAMIGFCGGVVVAMKFFMLRRLGIELGGSGDLLLDQTVDLMSRASISDNHAPIRYANVVRNMLATWHKTDKTALVREAWRFRRDFEHQSRFLGQYAFVAGQNAGQHENEPRSESGSSGSQSGSAGSQSGSAGPPDESQLQGDDFWSEFLQNNPVPHFASPLGI